MNQVLVCLTLTASTLSENAEIVRKYSKYIDVAELRADFLTPDEQLYVRKFPSMVSVPCILTIRRKADGGMFTSNEMSRTMLFGRALAFADQNPLKNFSYVDFEEDFHVPSLQEAALAFSIRIIRSCHDIEKPIKNLRAKCDSMRTTGYEIPKIAFMPKTLSDVTEMFREAAFITEYEHIFCAMGPMGQPSRILASRLNSYLTYTSPPEIKDNLTSIGHLDPIELNDVYRFREINSKTKLYAVTGWPLIKTSSPEIHNKTHKKNNNDAVMIPLRSPSITDILEFASELNVSAMAVTIPHKETIIPELIKLEGEAKEIKACNTVIHTDNGWVGYNTDVYGFQTSLSEFIGSKKLHRRHVAIIGAGGAAKAIAYVIKVMGGRACIFNRTLSHAKELAEEYNFEYSSLGLEALNKFEKYADIIIQTTSKGMNSTEIASKENDPIYFYQFKGSEKLFDLIYIPEKTPVMIRAEKAGCKVCNGLEMLKQQAYKQLDIFAKDNV